MNPPAPEPADRSRVPSTDGARPECDCPDCMGEELDPAQLLAALLDDVAPLADTENALEAELAAAAFLATVAPADDDVLVSLIDAFIPAVESRPGPGTVAVLRAIGSVAPCVEPRLAAAAADAADRLAAADVPEPAWAAELEQPVHVTRCVRLHGDAGVVSVLAAAFRRAEREHALMIVVNELEGAAAEIFLVDADQLPTALDGICAQLRAEGHAVREQALNPAAFRWYAEEALNARALDDEGDPADEEYLIDDDAELDDDTDAEDPPYPVMAQLARIRLAALPKARRPAGARSRSRQPTPLDLLNALGGASGGFGVPPTRRAAQTALPAKRGKKDGPAPVYQLKVGLRGSKPPIWRRLEVPADLSLAKLHYVIQAAFGWDDSHMHVFETPYGDFGRADRELDHRAEAPVTLEQVAPGATNKIRYTYDFGDDWEHEILVEKVLERNHDARTHPRCTGGRQAAPPEDCGGVWGYASLVEIIADPRHPEHEERLEWLGLDDPNQFDPAAFDLEQVNRALAKLR